MNIFSLFWLCFIVALGVPNDREEKTKSNRCKLNEWLDSQDVRLLEDANEIVKASKKRGKISWEEFNEAQKAGSSEHDYKILQLYNDDFIHGTIRLRRPVVAKIMETISFNPNSSEELDSFPNCNKHSSEYQEDYCEGDTANAYKLGFFAAITLEGRDQVILLNNNEIKMSDKFALQQRFFAIIEAADQPFINDQGPAQFGRVVQSCYNCTIMGGTLGRSSHLGVHGLNVRNFLVKDVVFRNYEESALTIAGGDTISVVDSEIKGSFADVPVRSTYSHARFLKKFLETAIRISGPDASKDLKIRYNALVKVMDVAYNDIMHGRGVIERKHKEAFDLFAEYTVYHDGKPLNIIDGLSYGMTFHSDAGEITNEYYMGVSSFKEQRATNITVKNVNIHNVQGNAKEIVGVTYPGTTATVTDTAEATLQLLHNSDRYSGEYKPDALIDAQLALSWWSSRKGGNDKVLVSIVENQKSDIGDELLDLWMLGKWAFEQEPKSINDVLNQNDMKWKCNIDSMGHTPKGVIGIFMQRVKGFLIKDVTLDGVRNLGEEGSMACGHYEYSPGLEGFVHNKGYSGASSKGIAIVGAKNGTLDNVKISNVMSLNGDSIGIDLFNYCDNIDLQNVEISDLKLGPSTKKSLPNYPAEARGIQISDDVKNMNMNHVTVNK